MTDDGLWIVVPNWGRFQHYKRRNPKWIKIYTSLLHHEPFLSLAPRHKGLLFDIWMLYAIHNGQLPASPAYIANQCGFPSEWVLRQRRGAGEGDGEDTVRMRDLKALEQAEFIQLVASKPLAIRGPETETKTERTRAREKTPKLDDAHKANAAAYRPFPHLEQDDFERELPDIARRWLNG